MPADPSQPARTAGLPLARTLSTHGRGLRARKAPAAGVPARDTAVMADLHGVPGHDRGTARAAPERDAGGAVTGRVLVSCPACGDGLPSRVRGPHPGWGEALAALHEHIGGGHTGCGQQPAGAR